MKIESEDLTIYYDMQCPYIYQKIEMVKQYCDTNNVPVSLIQVDTLQKAKDLPCVFNNWGVFYKGNFETVNLLLEVEHLKKAAFYTVDIGIDRMYPYTGQRCFVFLSVCLDGCQR